MERIKAICNKVPEKRYPLVAFLLTLLTVTMAMSYSEVLSNGRYVFQYGDLFQQLTSFQKMVTEQLSNGIWSYYSWNLFMGQNLSLVETFTMMSPFTFIFFVVKDVVLAAEICFILKVSCAAWAFCLFMQKGMKEKGIRTIFFSICYAMCAFQIQYLAANNLLDALYLLPLIMLALIHYVRTKKVLPLMLLYAASFVIQFYTGFLIGIFSGLCFIGILIANQGKRNKKQTMSLFTKYAFAVVTAILLSMVILCPAISYFIMNMSQSGGTFLKTRAIVTDCLQAMYIGHPFEMSKDIPYLYCGIPVLLLLPLYFVNSRISKRERIVSALILLFFMVSIYISPIYVALHLFNRPDGYTVRYAFLWIFVMVILACKQSNFLSEVTVKKAGIVGACLIAFYFVGSNLNQRMSSGSLGLKLSTTMINIVAITVWIVLFLAWKKGKNLFSVLFVMTFCILLECGGNEYLMLISMPFQKEEEYENVQAQVQLGIDAIRQSDATPLRIACCNGNNPNQGAAFNYMAVSGYGSAAKPNLIYLMAKLGDNVSLISVFQNGATDVTDMIFGVEYQIGIVPYNILSTTQPLPEVITNPYCLELGYMVSEDVEQLPLLGKNAFQNQNLILSAMTGITREVYVPATEPTIRTTNASLNEDQEGYYVTNENPDGQGVVDYIIPRDNHQEAYALFLQTAEGDTEMKENATGGEYFDRIYVVSRGDHRVYSESHRDLMRETAIVQMENYENQFQVSLYNVDQEQLRLGYKQALFYYQEEAELQAVYQELSANEWSVEAFDKTNIKATVEATEDKPILFMSIPYDEGWVILVDGVKCEKLQLLENTFMGVELTPGVHEIELNYVTPGVRTGCYLAIAGVVLTVILSILECRNKGDKENEKK